MVSDLICNTFVFELLYKRGIINSVNIPHQLKCAFWEEGDLYPFYH